MLHPDAIQTVPADAPDWTENAVFQVFDSRAGVSVWAHWGRFPQAPHIWEEIVVVFLPGERLLASRSFGSSVFRCVEPGERWHMTFDGMARTTTTAELAAGPLADGPVEHVAIDLAFTGVHPIYGGAASDQRWATAHFDHGGRIEGTVTHAGHTHEIASHGFRDHSYGARDYSKLVGDTWCTAVFESGCALLGIEVWQHEAPTHSDGFLFDGTMQPKVTMELPRLEDPRGAPHRFTMTLNGEQIEVEQQANMTMTFGRPVGLVLGARLDDPDLPVITEGPARVTWGGETADGWIEKSLRPGLFSND